MPQVNVKYKLSIDNTISTIDHLKFGGKSYDHDGDKKSNVLWEGEVKDVFANNLIQVNMLVGGFGKWSLEVSVIKLSDDGSEVGEWKKLVVFPIEGKAPSNNKISQRKKINW
ncbi:MAG: hypothetical protein RIC06_15065 [Cyclobacteriaceae bacterium]